MIKPKGFTTVEIAVFSLLIVILGTAILGLHVILGTSQVETSQSTVELDEANNAVSRMVREIRTARRGGNGAYTIEYAADNDFSFYSDYDFDDSTEKIRYYLENNELKKSVIEPTGTPITYPPDQAVTNVISDKVRNAGVPVFAYFNDTWPEDSENNPLTTPADISEVRLVDVYLRVNTKENEPETDFVVESTAQIRTLKDNL